MEHPSAAEEWSLRTKLAAIRDAGFDGVCWGPSEELTALAREYDLLFVGGMAPATAAEITPALHALARSGTRYVNVQLATDMTPAGEALAMCLQLEREARVLGLQPVIETHRGTCTETPEKFYALADAYEQATGEPLAVAWDFSHFGVVKHLLPEHFAPRLLVRPEMVQQANHFHLRPFNGHHAQVPIVGVDGCLTREVREWLPFAEQVLRLWLAVPSNAERELFVCPELGPQLGGYALSTFAASWPQAVALRQVILDLWQRLHA
ncbi:MAG: xylose isomerase [Acidobacteriota bacterium]|nr:xylose isomerase [Acidobacteriota bacterium]